MKNKVVVENTLTPYIEHLKSAGYDVHTLYKNSNLKNITSDQYKAVVVSGLDNLGYREGDSNNPPVPIIEAKGSTPQEVQNIIENKLE
ncbi:YkuS family protein [Schnuerera sp. xch1]|uniref:YkuS family protein n=1 Tax=Schnuerera sp. xch1 TaxID=2874283 RepID=UPI001CBD6069|nr:YkuS family protein [Schnuerera sp. xch1]MBZ2175543.1 YkuS family protein [Schnuerera sp. xch1]